MKLRNGRKKSATKTLLVIGRMKGNKVVKQKIEKIKILFLRKKILLDLLTKTQVYLQSLENCKSPNKTC